MKFNKIAKGFFSIAFFEKLLLILNFIGGIFLARMLIPDDFGVIAYISAIVAFIMLFQSFKVVNYIIHCDGDSFHTKEIKSAVFIQYIANIIIGILFILVYYLFLEGNYKDIFLILAASNFISGFFSIYDGVYIKDMRFFALGIIKFFSSLTAYIVSIYLAVNDFGIYSLVNLLSIKTLLPNILKFAFSYHYIYPEYSALYSKKILSFFKFSFLSSLYNQSTNIMTVFTIKFFSTVSNLGFYDKSKGLASFVNNFIESVIGIVSAPVFSNRKDDKNKLSVTIQD
jgi:O-antigen/teichoic acid export membrane protein